MKKKSLIVEFKMNLSKEKTKLESLSRSTHGDITIHRLRIPEINNFYKLCL